MTFKHPFALAHRSVLDSGHRYRFAVSEREKIQHWWYGSRDDVLVDSYEEDTLRSEGGPAIVVDFASPAEFEVLEDEDDDSSVKKSHEVA